MERTLEMCPYLYSDPSRLQPCNLAIDPVVRIEEEDMASWKKMQQRVSVFLLW